MAPRLVLSLLFGEMICSAIGWSPIAFSQEGSGSSRTDPSRATRPRTPEEFYSSFWSFICKPGAAYNTWKVMAHAPTGDGIENPHSVVSDTHVDKVGGGNPAQLPNESILIREDYDGQRKRQSISVMYRVKDYDKDHGNWYWLRYLEDGSVARGPDGKSLAGKVTSCIDCHAKAKGQDFVFSNDTIQGHQPKDSKPPADQKPKENEAKE